MSDYLVNILDFTQDEEQATEQHGNGKVRYAVNVTWGFIFVKDKAYLINEFGCGFGNPVSDINTCKIPLQAQGVTIDNLRLIGIMPDIMVIVNSKSLDNVTNVVLLEDFLHKNRTHNEFLNYEQWQSFLAWMETLP